MQYQDRRSISSVVSIVFDSLHVFISELLDSLLPIKNGYIMGGGGVDQFHGVGAIGMVLIFATLK